jgi:hypothetical protein
MSCSLTSTINSGTGVYEVTGLTVDLAVNTFRASIPTNISPTGSAVTIDQTYSISKSTKGNSGAGGDDSKVVQLTAADYSIVYDQDGANPSPSSTITLTASTQNFTDPYFKFTGDGITDETSYTDGTGANDTFTFSVPSSHFTTPKTIRVGVAEADAATTEVSFDTISIFGVRQGSNAYTVILDNEAHAFAANSSGSISSFSGSGATIEAYRGSTQLNGITSGTPTTDEFKVTVSQANNITAGAISSSGDPVVIADHSAMTSSTASIVYSINLEGIQTVLKKQSFSRTNDGTDGTAQAGTRLVELELYYQIDLTGATTSFTAPSAPSTGVYNFSNDTIASIPAGWSRTQPADEAGKFTYISTALAVESSSGST